MKKIIFIFLYVFFNSILNAQTITRIDNSRISANELDKKIRQLMRDASVTGIAVSVFNDGNPVYNKVFGYKNLTTKAPLQAKKSS